MKHIAGHTLDYVQCNSGVGCVIPMSWWTCPWHSRVAEPCSHNAKQAESSISTRAAHRPAQSGNHHFCGTRPQWQHRRVDLRPKNLPHDAVSGVLLLPILPVHSGLATGPRARCAFWFSPFRRLLCSPRWRSLAPGPATQAFGRCPLPHSLSLGALMSTFSAPTGSSLSPGQCLVLW